MEEWETREKGGGAQNRKERKKVRARKLAGLNIKLHFAIGAAAGVDAKIRHAEIPRPSTGKTGLRLAAGEYPYSSGIKLLLLCLCAPSLMETFRFSKESRLARVKTARREREPIDKSAALPLFAFAGHFRNVQSGTSKIQAS